MTSGNGELRPYALVMFLRPSEEHLGGKKTNRFFRAKNNNLQFVLAESDRISLGRGSWPHKKADETQTSTKHQRQIMSGDVSGNMSRTRLGSRLGGVLVRHGFFMVRRRPGTPTLTIFKCTEHRAQCTEHIITHAMRAGTRWRIQ